MGFYPDRKDELVQIVTQVVSAAMLFDTDGISVRFMNWQPKPRQGGHGAGAGEVYEDMLDNVQSADFLQNLVKSHNYSGVTPLGTQLKAKVLDPLVFSQMWSGRLKKPILIITITDGEPQGESKDALRRNIQDAVNGTMENWHNMRQGHPSYEAFRREQRAVAFQIAQVGNDTKATDFLASLDKDPAIGDVVDVTSSECQNISDFRETNFRP